MAKVHNFLGIWQGSKNLHATRKEFRTQNKQMTAIGYISDTEVIVKASWSLFHHDGAAAFIFSEWSPLPPALLAKDLPGGHTRILNVRQIRRINRHPADSDEDSTPQRISDTENWLTWHQDLDNPNDSEDDCTADVQSAIEQDNRIHDPESPEQRDVSTVPNVRGLIQLTVKSKRQAEKVLVMLNSIETRRNQGVKNTYDRMGQCFNSFFMYLDREFQLEIYSVRMVRHSLWISVDEPMYSRRNKSFWRYINFSCVRVNSARMMLRLALPPGRVSICPKYNH